MYSYLKTAAIRHYLLLVIVNILGQIVKQRLPFLAVQGLLQRLHIRRDPRDQYLWHIAIECVPSVNYLQAHSSDGRYKLAHDELQILAVAPRTYVPLH